MNMEIKGVVAENIKKYRKALGKSQKELAQISEVGARAICRIECADGNPTLECLAKLATALQIPVKELFN